MTSSEPMRKRLLTPYYEDSMVTIYHGDCLTVLPQLASSVGLVLTDLPYGTTDSAWDSVIDLPPLWREWRRLLAPNRAVVMTASQPFTTSVVASNLGAFKCEWIWVKNAGSNFGNVRFQPMKEHESVLVFGWDRVLYQPIMQERAASGLSRVRSGVVNYHTESEVYRLGQLKGDVTSARPDLRYPSSVQKFNRERGLHSNQKPVALMEYLVRTYSLSGEVVLDPCMGSGTTLVAAARAGRRAIGIEIEERYCEIAARRLSQDVLPLTEELPA